MTVGYQNDLAVVRNRHVWFTRSFTRRDVETVIAAQRGHGGLYIDWIALLKLRDGRYAYVEAFTNESDWASFGQGRALVDEDLGRLVSQFVPPGALGRFNLTPMELLAHMGDAS